VGVLDGCPGFPTGVHDHLGVAQRLGAAVLDEAVPDRGHHEGCLVVVAERSPVGVVLGGEHGLRRPPPLPSPSGVGGTRPAV